MGERESINIFRNVLHTHPHTEASIQFVKPRGGAVGVLAIIFMAIMFSEFGKM